MVLASRGGHAREKTQIYLNTSCSSLSPQDCSSDSRKADHPPQRKRERALGCTCSISASRTAKSSAEPQKIAAPRGALILTRSRRAVRRTQTIRSYSPKDKEAPCLFVLRCPGAHAWHARKYTGESATCTINCPALAVCCVASAHRLQCYQEPGNSSAKAF